MRAGAVCCAFLLALAVGNVSVQASGVTRGLPTDDKVAIVLNPSPLLFDTCPKLPALTMNVRLQTLKTKSGAIFRRKTVTDGLFACLAALGSQPLGASTIKECSERTETAGLEMFRWDGGLCTGYTNGIPESIIRCAGAGSVVLYTLHVEAIRPVVSNITLAFSGNTLNAAWDVTPTNSCFPVVYRVRFNNHDTFVSDKLATVSLETASPCAEYPLTVTPVDTNSVVMGSAATVKVVTPKGLKLSLKLTHGVTTVNASWGTEYTCNTSNPPITEGHIKSYLVELGSQNATINNSTFWFTFDQQIGCCSDTASTLTADLNKVTLKVFGDTGAQLGDVTATLTNTIRPGHRYPSDYANCFYYQKLEETTGGVGLTYDQLLDFCLNTMDSDIYGLEEYLEIYTAELTYLNNQTPSVVVGPHYLGLKRNRTTSKWVGRSGRTLTAKSPFWDSGEPTTAEDCVTMKANRKLSAVSCTATNMTTVCFDFFG